MGPAKKDLIAHLYPTVWIIKLCSCSSILVLAGLLCLEINYNTLASPLTDIYTSSGLVSQQVTSNVPSVVLNAVRQDLARRTKISASEFKVKESKQQTWPDGCLGLATSDEMCTQALVEGWRLVMTYKQQIWVYRTDNMGRVLRLEPKKQ